MHVHELCVASCMFGPTVVISCCVLAALSSSSCTAGVAYSYSMQKAFLMLLCALLVQAPGYADIWLHPLLPMQLAVAVVRFLHVAVSSTHAQQQQQHAVPQMSVLRFSTVQHIYMCRNLWIGCCVPTASTINPGTRGKLPAVAWTGVFVPHPHQLSCSHAQALHVHMRASQQLRHRHLAAQLLP